MPETNEIRVFPPERSTPWLYEEDGLPPVIAHKPYSNHPEDHYLAIVLVQLGDDQSTPYATYVKNTSRPQGTFFAEGVYCRTLADALESFNKRGYIHLPGLSTGKEGVVTL